MGVLEEIRSEAVTATETDIVEVDGLAIDSDGQFRSLPLL